MNTILSFPRPDIVYSTKIHRDKFLWENTSYDGWYVIIVKSGMFELRMNNKKDTASGGDIVIFPPGAAFLRHIVKPLDFLYINFKWKGTVTEDFLLEYSICGKLEFIDDTRVRQNIDTLFAFSDPQTPDMFSISNHYFSDILYEYCKLRMNDHIIDYKNISDAVVSGAVKHINKFYSSPVKISEIAADFNMSHVNFTNRFIRSVGMTPIKYLRRIRLNNSQILLLSTDLSVNEISRLCGFENQFYFSRSFSEFYGVPPSEYRLRNLV